MSWFFYALLCTLAWGAADLFYKRGADDGDPFSHLRQAVWVGLIMGAGSALLLLLPGGLHSGRELLRDALRYAPASLCYIISMVIGYAGLRYLELSIVSPVQNASGALSALLMLFYFLGTGRIASVREEFSPRSLIGTGLIALGVIALAIVEQRLSAAEAGEPPEAAESKRFRLGAGALLFPLLYCLFDTLGTAADGILLDGESGLGLGETDILILYGLTFALAGLIAWCWLWIREKRPYNPFAKSELPKAGAALCEEAGQVFYVFAMARNPILAAPMVASYCIVSVLLSRLFLKEKLTKGQYLCIAAVIGGILLMGA